MQHEQRLQNLSSGTRLALQAEFSQRFALFVGAIIPSVTGVLAITGSAGTSHFFRLL
jgi:hypothetical protein